MQKMIKKFMFIALIIFFIELIGIVGLVFVSKILPDFKYTEDILVISICAVVVIDLLYISLVLSNVSNSRKKNDITAVEIVGEGIEEVYNFGENSFSRVVIVKAPHFTGLKSKWQLRMYRQLLCIHLQE